MSPNADGAEATEEQNTQVAMGRPVAEEPPKRPLTMMTVLAKVEEIQAGSKCGTDLSEFILEYVDACLVLSKNNRPIIPIWEHLGAKFMLCKKCFHPNIQGMQAHLDPACKEKCCGITRCKFCLHPHKEAYCPCTHTFDFFRWFEKNLKE